MSQITETDNLIYCINPHCHSRQNPDILNRCQACNTSLLIAERYRLLKPLRALQESPTTEIFEVEDWSASREDWGKPKVLKVLTSDRNPQLVRMFKTEARVLTCLRHGKIPRVELDEYFTVYPNNSSTKLHCLVMEQIEGISLEQWLQDNNPISQVKARDWLGQLVKILDYVHNKGFFHRDIKPSNIMLRPDGQLVLIDFGTARDMTPTYVDKFAQEDVTQVMSLGYTPPEQINGQALPKSDFFALGRTFVHLLTGRHPITLEGESGQLTGWRDCCTALDEDFASLIDDLMAPVSSNRPNNTQVILQRLSAEQVADAPSSSLTDLNFPAGHLIRFSLRHIYPLIPAGVLGLFLLGLIGIPLVSPQIAVACNKRGVKQHKAGRSLIAQLYYTCSLNFNPQQAKAHYNLGALYQKQGNLPRARAEYEKAIQGGLSAAYNNLARLEILEGKYSSAVPLLLEGIQLAEWNKEKYAFLKNLGWVLFKQGDYALAKTYLQEAIELDPERAAAYCLQAQVKDAQDAPKEALVESNKCIKYLSRDRVPEEEVNHWIN